MKLKPLHFNNNLITTVCIGLLIFGIAAYIYFLSLSVVHVVMRKETTAQIGQIRSDIAYLESSYIEARHQISARVASLEGFNQNQNKVFISRKEQSLVLHTASE